MLQDISSELVTLSSRLIGEKVLITDVTGTIIGCSNADRLGELHEASLQVIQTGRPSYHDKNAASALRGTFAGITLPLNLAGKTVGTVGITGDPERVSQYGQLIQAFTEMMLRYRAGRLQQEYRDQEQQNLVRAILHFNGEPEQEQMIRSMGDALGFDPDSTRTAIQIESETVHREPDAESLKEAVRLAFDTKDNLCVDLNDRCCLILTAGGEIRERCEALIDRRQMIGQPVFISIGNTASSLNSLREACETAADIARIGALLPQRPPILTLEDVALERLISGIPLKRADPRAERALALLTEQKDAAELRRLIINWCENSFRISDTAAAMFIHKNTLIYRMDRVQRLTVLIFARSGMP